MVACAGRVCVGDVSWRAVGGEVYGARSDSGGVEQSGGQQCVPGGGAVAGGVGPAQRCGKGGDCCRAGARLRGPVDWSGVRGGCGGWTHPAPGSVPPRRQGSGHVRGDAAGAGPGGGGDPHRRVGIGSSRYQTGRGGLAGGHGCCSNGRGHSGMASPGGRSGDRGGGGGYRPPP